MRKMKKFNIFLLALSVALILAVTLPAAMAWFSTYVTALGMPTPILLSTKTKIVENFSNWTKHIVISNDAGSDQAVYVRVTVKAGEVYTLTPGNAENRDMTDGRDQNGNEVDLRGVAVADGRWYDGKDGYWYFSGVVRPGEKTSRLDVRIDFTEEAPKDGSFNVVVLYETTPVIYNSDGSPKDPEELFANDMITKYTD